MSGIIYEYHWQFQNNLCCSNWDGYYRWLLWDYYQKILVSFHWVNFQYCHVCRRRAIAQGKLYPAYIYEYHWQFQIDLCCSNDQRYYIYLRWALSDIKLRWVLYMIIVGLLPRNISNFPLGEFPVSVCMKKVGIHSR